MTTIRTNAPSSIIERLQINDEPLRVPNPGGIERDDEDITVVTVDGEKFAGCYVVEMNDEYIEIGVS
jgi:hypothetical protein